jgi:hypothetical protein
MDDTIASNSPRTMFPVIKDDMLAPSDQRAIDAVAAKRTRLDPRSLEYIKVAHTDDPGDPRDIEVVGSDTSRYRRASRI